MPDSGAGRHVALFGECMVELRETSAAAGGPAEGVMRQGFGGDTLNTAIYLARCGAVHGLSVSYVCGLGVDRFSDRMLAHWQSEGIGVDLVRRIDGRVPGLYVISVDAQGERCFTYWREHSAARAYFDVNPTPLETIAPSLSAFYVSGISLAILTPAARERLFGAMQLVRANGGLVCFDNNYRSALWPNAQCASENHRRAMELSNLALLTLEDERALHGPTHDEAGILAASRAIGMAEVVIKRGAAPTLVYEASGGISEIAPPTVSRVVDTTAAGDSFAGAYLACRLSGGSATNAAQAGNRLAAVVVQHHGAIIARDKMPQLQSAG